MQALLLAACSLLVPLPLKHHLWVQLLALRLAVWRISPLAALHAALPQSASHCVRWVRGARLAMLAVAPSSAAHAPSPPAGAACWMVHMWVVVMVGFVLPAVVLAALAQHQKQQGQQQQQQPALNARGGNSASGTGTGSSTSTNEQAKQPGSPCLQSGGPPQQGHGRLQAGSPAQQGQHQEQGQPQPQPQPKQAGSLSKPREQQPDVATPSTGATLGSSSSGSPQGGNTTEGSEQALNRLLPAGIDASDVSGASSPSADSPSTPCAGSGEGGPTPATLRHLQLAITMFGWLGLLVPSGAMVWAALEVAVGYGCGGCSVA